MSEATREHAIQTTVMLQDFSRYAGLLAESLADDSGKTGIKKWWFARAEKKRVEAMFDEFRAVSLAENISCIITDAEPEHPAIILAKMAYR